MSNGHPVTKDELESVLKAALSDFGSGLRGEFRAALAETKGELRNEFRAALSETKGDLRNEFRAALAETKSELLDEINTSIDAAKLELREFTRQIETNLLTEFHRYAKGQQARLHTLEISSSDLVSRLASIEERLLALEIRRPPAA